MSVSLAVCHPAKAVGQNEMPFDRDTQVVPDNVVFSGGSTGGQSGHGLHPVRQPGHKLNKMHIHCGQLILGQISKIGSTRCQILRLKYTKFHFRCGSAPDPAAWGSLQRSPDPTIFKGPTSKGRERKSGGEGKGEGKGRGGKGGRVASPNWGVWIRQCCDYIKPIHTKKNKKEHNTI